MKKYLAAAAVVAAMAGAATTAQAFAVTKPAGPATHVASAPAASGKSTATPKPLESPKAAAASTVRVVAVGEKVQALPGVTLWLTAEGKHWSAPEQSDQFRSAVDGNLAPGSASAQQEGVNGRLFLSGVFLGTGDEARVEIATQDDTLSGHILTLAGHPGWGVWYADGGPSKPHHAIDPQHPFHSDVRKVTVYDSAGKVISQLVVPDHG
ncbi:hypothetical protein ACWCXH_36145 [Kitasatospora sp. NPDC001660]